MVKHYQENVVERLKNKSQTLCPKCNSTGSNLEMRVVAQGEQITTYKVECTSCEWHFITHCKSEVRVTNMKTR